MYMPDLHHSLGRGRGEQNPDTGGRVVPVERPCEEEQCGTWSGSLNAMGDGGDSGQGALPPSLPPSFPLPLPLSISLSHAHTCMDVGRIAAEATAEQVFAVPARQHQDVNDRPAARQQNARRLLQALRS